MNRVNSKAFSDAVVMDVQPSVLSGSQSPVTISSSLLQPCSLAAFSNSTPFGLFGRQTSMSFHKHLLPPLRRRSTSPSNTELRRGSAARDFICDGGRMRFLLLLCSREGSSNYFCHFVSKTALLNNLHSAVKFSSKSKARPCALNP